MRKCNAQHGIATQTRRNTRQRATALALVVVATALAGACERSQPHPSTRFPVPPPPTPTVLAGGESLFVAHCQRCHGQYALGSDSGPPLVHAIYAPSHHSDAAFILAARNGVRAHHWTFGDMPPQPAVDESKAWDIVAWVRWLQQEAGIR